ncbi:translation initiation factor IF-2-like [Oxyura jamaicensis]|uniref:translation initiation factor IF-2-like n=1 Tax=Oxyura jamaicensis TaxID=8884 RepID=UPI0015A4FE5A|nr:translation initiation factor IF-2-like [Oxyura jamaicensis]
MLLPLAPGSCRPRGVTPPALGRVPPTGCLAPAASVCGAGDGSGAQEPPPAPVFASLPRGAGPGPDPSQRSAGEGAPGKGHPQGAVGQSQPPLPPLCKAPCKRAHGTRPQGKAGGGARGTTKLGGSPQPGLGHCGAGCVPVGLGACPWGWVTAQGSVLGDGEGWGGWRALTRTGRQQPPCLEAALAGAEAGLCLTPLGAAWGPPLVRAHSGCRLGPSCCPGAWLLPCPPWEAVGLILQLGGCLPGPCPCPGLSPAPSQGQVCSLWPWPRPWPLPTALPQWLRPELRQAQVPLPLPRPRRAAGLGRRHRPGRQLLPRGRPGTRLLTAEEGARPGGAGREAGRDANSPSGPCFTPE